VAIAQKTPRLVFKYTTISSKLLTIKVALKVKSPFTTELTNIAAAIPNYNESTLGELLFSVGLGIDLKKAIDFANTQANRINENPYQCEEFADLNEAAASTTGMSGMVPQFLTTLRGAFVGVQEADFNQGADSVKGVAMLGSSNPMDVFSQLRTFVPQLQNIQLKPDGVAVAVPDLAQEIGVSSFFITMNEQVLGVSTGAGMQEAVAQRVAVQPVATDAPLLVFSYDYGQLMSEWSRQTSMGMADPQSAELLDTMSTLFGLVVMKFYATDHALVLDYEMAIHPSAATKATP